MTDERRGTVAYALLQAVFVVLGVVLALVANEWRQDAADAERARTAAASIIEELRANRAAVAASLDYHRGLLEALSARGPDAGPLDPRGFPRGFVSPARLNRTAWDSASDVGVLAHIPYRQVLDLSQVYSLQERYEEQARSVGQLFYRKILEEGIGSIPARPGNLGSIISMFVHRETELLALYDETLGRAGGAP